MIWLRSLSLAVALGVLTLAAPAATAKGPSTSLRTPRTLVSSPRPIHAFAQDGNAVGWIASRISLAAFTAISITPAVPDALSSAPVLWAPPVHSQQPKQDWRAPQRRRAARHAPRRCT